MPYQSPKKTWLFGHKMVWVYNDDEKAILRLNKKIGIDLLTISKEVPNVLCDNKGELISTKFWYKCVEYKIAVGVRTIYVFATNSAGEVKMIGIIPRAVKYKAKGEMLYHTIVHSYVA